MRDRHRLGAGVRHRVELHHRRDPRRTDRLPVFVAEGIFAADITDRCRELGLLADTLCLRGSPAVTAWRRFRRDLAEGRKSVTVLLRRGWRLMRGERAIVARQTALGAYPCGQDEALRRITALPLPAPRAADQPTDIPVDA